MEQTGLVLVGPLNWGDPVSRDGEFILPVGTVTMLLADVEGSTRRWEEDEEAMATTMAEMSNLVGEIVGRNHGVRPLEQGEGDSFVAAFARPSEAVACALDIVRSVTLPLRVAIHSGEAQRTNDGTYVGPALNRAGRLRDAAHGGQVVLSQATVELIADRLPTDAAVRDLGVHRLRDLSKPERIFQLVHPELRVDFQRLRSLDTYRHNLPLRRTSFVGRREEMAEVGSLLDDSQLVTLTGAGGCGKTRLALQVAAGLLDGFPDGVFLADLSTVTDAADVTSTVARSAGLGEEVAGILAEVLLEKCLLLVIDNCEHVVSECAVLCDQLLANCPRVRVLATSREPLHVAGETTFAVPSLPVPPEGQLGGIVGLTPYAAAELFLDRARRARSDFGRIDEDAAAVADICRRLDGIPLAIELAAARVRVLTPRQISDGLHERFRLLTGGPRTAMPRQQTLTASMDWSHDLLTDLEKTVLRRLSVFTAGFTLDAAAHVGSGGGIETHQVLDLLSLLVDKSLVEADTSHGQARYRLLETIRQYAFERLVDAGEDEDTRLRHRDHFVAAAESLGEQIFGERAVDAFDAFGRFLHERDNLEAAFRLSCARGDLEQAARFVAALTAARDMVWVGDALAWTTALVPDGEPARLPEPARADVLYGAAWECTFGFNVFGQSSPEEAARETIEHHRGSDDDRRLARGLVAWLSMTSADEGVASAADEAISLAERAGEPWTAALARVNAVRLLAVDRGQADKYLEALVDQFRALDAPLLRYAVISRLAMRFAEHDPRRAGAIYDELLHGIDYTPVPDVERHVRSDRIGSLVFEGRLDEARVLAQDSVPRHQEAGDFNCLTNMHLWLGMIEDMAGDGASAVAHVEQARAVAASLGWPAPYLEAFLGYITLGRGELERAERLYLGVKDQLSTIDIGAYVDQLGACINFRRGDLDAAEDAAHSSLRRTETAVVVPALEVLSSIAAAEGRHVEAARMLGGANGARERTGYRFEMAIFRTLTAEALASVRGALDEDAFQRAWDEGRAMTTAEVLTYVRRGRGERGRPATGWKSLTPAERQVVDLVAQGLSNAAIAQRLFISVRTVTTHLTHVYAKLGLATRTELAALAARRAV